MDAAGEPVTQTLAEVDRQHADESAATRRDLVAGTAALLGGLGLTPTLADAARRSPNSPQRILNVAATAEVLATIVNTVGPEKLGGEMDATTLRNTQASAREELIHYEVLTSKRFGARPATTRIWIPDLVFDDLRNFLGTIIVGDQIFVNAYLIGVATFGHAGNGTLARIAAEFMAVESVHRALARQSLTLLGNDRAFAKFNQRELARDDLNAAHQGFTRVDAAITQLEQAGFGFGRTGLMPGAFYDFDEVRRRTPDPGDVNTRAPR